MSRIKDWGAPKKATATHATAAVASITGVAGQTYYVCNVSVSSDKAASVFLVKDGTTTIWQGQVGATYRDIPFDPPLPCTSGALASAEIDGTAACYANISVVAV
jgi:hypothetical protein